MLEMTYSACRLSRGFGMTSFCLYPGLPGDYAATVRRRCDRPFGGEIAQHHDREKQTNATPHNHPLATHQSSAMVGQTA